MSDDLVQSLDEHKAQLQQVTAALLADPENEELLKLKSDLEEVIELTSELIPGPSEEKEGGHGVDEALAQAAAAMAGVADEEIKAATNKKFKPGDKCLTKCSKDGRFHEATVEAISEGKAAVTFADLGVTELTDIGYLRPIFAPEVRKRLAEKKRLELKNSAGKKNKFQVDKEKRKAKALKRTQKLKDLEAAKESEKTKWHEFNKKAKAKSMRGVKRSSIFESPRDPTGKVGVGTCGVGGKPMTRHRHQPNYQKPAGGYY